MVNHTLYQGYVRHFVFAPNFNAPNRASGHLSEMSEVKQCEYP